MQRAELAGQRFGKRVVIEFAGMIDPSGNHPRSTWRVRCDCGREQVIGLHCLRKSPHCRHCNPPRTGEKATLYKHGMSQTRAHGIWRGMIVRVTCPHRRSWQDYGAKGITVCDRWREFKNFIADMGHPPDGMTLERKDNDGNYCPENCVWASRTRQNRNKRKHFRVTYKGETRILSEWAEILGLKYITVYERIKRGWSIELAFETPAVLGGNKHIMHPSTSPKRKRRPRSGDTRSPHSPKPSPPACPPTADLLLFPPTSA